MATATAPAPTSAAPAPTTANPSTMGSGLAALAKPPAQAVAQAQAQPSTTTPPAYVPETGTPTTKAVAIPGGLPSSQASMLHDLASISLGFADPVGPGQVTGQQQQVLAAWKENANSDYSQYMASHGFSAIAQDPGALFNEEALAAQANWSMLDNKGAMNALQVSAKDYDEWKKIEAKKKSSLMHEIMGVAEIAVGVVIDFYTGGLGGNALIVAGAGTLSSS